MSGAGAPPIFCCWAEGCAVGASTSATAADTFLEMFWGAHFLERLFGSRPKDVDAEDLALLEAGKVLRDCECIIVHFMPICTVVSPINSNVLNLYFKNLSNE